MGIPDTFRWEAIAPGDGPNAPLSGYFRNQHETLARMQKDYPELGHWSLQAVAVAWKRYSSAFHGTLWVPYPGRDITFLGFILLAGEEQGRPLDASDAELCQASFQGWASFQAALVRRRIEQSGA